MYTIQGNIYDDLVFNAADRNPSTLSHCLLWAISKTTCNFAFTVVTLPLWNNEVRNPSDLAFRKALFPTAAQTSGS